MPPCSHTFRCPSCRMAMILLFRRRTVCSQRQAASSQMEWQHMARGSPGWRTLQTRRCPQLKTSPTRQSRRLQKMPHRQQADQHQQVLRYGKIPHQARTAKDGWPDCVACSSQVHAACGSVCRSKNPSTSMRSVAASLWCIPAAAGGIHPSVLGLSNGMAPAAGGPVSASRPGSDEGSKRRRWGPSNSTRS